MKFVGEVVRGSQSQLMMPALQRVPLGTHAGLSSNAAEHSSQLDGFSETMLRCMFS